jgi:hypothetical protein
LPSNSYLRLGKVLARRAFRLTVHGPTGSSLEDGTPADPPTFRSAVLTWKAGDTIPLGRDRTLRVVAVRPGQEAYEDPVLVVEAARPPSRFFALP